ncbi:hypothetical protein PanWU01x14_308960 [Parasponia andersonii]|uniref:Uncharacterized protein n=1 Tax=Parasponia andersonii TaxID=3476 RepID=A0A2P5AR20_PARAD|nr:hypothetical protein PanWU01x14_308960 [Parasponia andersonii]
MALASNVLRVIFSKWYFGWSLDESRNNIPLNLEAEIPKRAVATRSKIWDSASSKLDLQSLCPLSFFCISALTARSRGSPVEQRTLPHPKSLVVAETVLAAQQSSAQKSSADSDELGDEEGLVKLDATLLEVYWAAVIHLVENPDYVQDG